MLRIFVAVLIALVTAAPAAAQVIYDAAPAGVWFISTTCPANWATFTPTETRPAQPDIYRVRRPTGGAPMLWSRAAVERAWTVNGTLQQAALDAALASGAVVSLRPGRAAQIRCAWRPLGGSP